MPASAIMARSFHMGAGTVTNVPSDAGAYASSLTSLLNRIIDTAERYLGCGPGWYGILSELEGRIATVDPSCTLSSIREIDGRLYVTIDTCQELAAPAVKAAVNLARRQSELVCEFSGRPGVLMERDGSLRTLSPTRAPSGYRLVRKECADLQTAHLTSVVSDLIDELNTLRR